MKCYKIFRRKNGKLVSINDWLPPALIHTYSETEPNYPQGNSEFMLFKELSSALAWLNEAILPKQYQLEIWQVDALRPRQVDTVLGLGNCAYFTGEYLKTTLTNLILGWWKPTPARRTAYIHWSPYPGSTTIYAGAAKTPAGTYGTKRVTLIKKIEVQDEMRQ